MAVNRKGLSFDDDMAASLGDLDDAAVTDPTASASIIAALKGIIKQLQGAGSGEADVDVIDREARLLGKVSNYDVLANGTLTQLDSVVTLATANLSTVGLGVSGTWVGTIVAEGDVGDGVWATIPMLQSLTAALSLSTTANGNFFIGVAGFLNIRIRMSLYTSGTATVYLEGSSAPAGVFLCRSLPTGTNVIGQVNISSISAIDGQAAMAASLPVTIASDQTDYRGKGSVTTAHAAIAATTTSTEISHLGYNGTMLNCEGTLESGQTWIVEILGCAVTGGNVGKSYYQDFEQKITITYADLLTDGVVNFTCPGVQNYVKIRATLSGGTAALTVRVTPVNL